MEKENDIISIWIQKLNENLGNKDRVDLFEVYSNILYWLRSIPHAVNMKIAFPSKNSIPPNTATATARRWMLGEGEGESGRASVWACVCHLKYH